MFKNATIYKFTPVPFGIDREAILEAAAFTPTAPTQQFSIGFERPRGIGGVYAESIGGHGLLRVVSETRSVPAATLAKAVDALADSIERETGRKPGRKERRELKDQALLELLPKAFPKQAATWVWIDVQNHRLVIDTKSSSRCDDVVTLLVKTIPGLKVQPVQTNMNPATIMSAWLHDGEADYKEFNLGRSCELRTHDDIKAVVRYANHHLDIDEVREHIRAGKSAAKLALDWKGRVAFTLDDCLRLAKIDLLDVVLEEKAAKTAEDRSEALDADFAIVTGELGALITDLIAAMDGELEMGAETEE